MILVFDNNLNFMGVVEEFEYFSATLNYCDVGLFELKCIYDQKLVLLLKEGYFVRYKEFVGRIDAITYYGSPEETSITVYGYDLSGFLTMRYSKDTYHYAGGADLFCRYLVRDNCIVDKCEPNRVIPHLHFGTHNHLPAQTDSTTAFLSLLEEIQVVLAPYDYGFKTTADFESKRLLFEVYDGVDNGVVIGNEFDNVLTQDYAYSSHNNISTVYAYTEDKRLTYKDELTGYDRKEIVIQSSASLEDGMTNSQYEAQILQEAKSNVEATTLVYDVTVPEGVELEVGEKITAVNKQWGINFKTRVESKSYVLENGIITVNYIIGNDMKKGKK